MATDRLKIKAAVAELGELAQLDVPLGIRTTYRVGGNASVLVEVNTQADVQRVAAARAASELPVLVLGRGSNLLISDAGFLGIAISMGDGLATFDVTDGPVVEAGAALALPVLARRSVLAGLAGLEWSVGVPGSVGGAVRMNAGGHGADVAGSLIDADVVSLDTGEFMTIGNADLGFRFRGSTVGPTQLVVLARFSATPGTREQSEESLREIVRWRRENQPGGQNAGSVFVNPFEGAESAGRLIDEVGLKGFRMGSAHVSAKHANFIQADEGGSADDVRKLMAHVVQRVRDEHDIVLRSEIQLVGFEQNSFDENSVGKDDQ